MMTRDLDVGLNIWSLNELFHIAAFHNEQSWGKDNVSFWARLTPGVGDLGFTNDHYERKRIVRCGASKHATRKYPRGVLQLFSQVDYDAFQLHSV